MASPSVNLLGPNISFIDRFVNWALTIGRVVVISTEVIALSAFLYRFSLDRQLIDIHSKIKQEQAVVTYLKPSEEIYRNLQARLSLADSFSQQSRDEVKILNDMVKFAPADFTFNTISLQEDRIKLNISTGLVSSLSDFVKSLRTYSKITNVIVDKIENHPASATITVSITAILKQQTYAPK
ncbi:MAG TPA: hypothetical protein VFA93_03135 [Patescibacteria group bacterium]|nr:hypothetical protein [Patescibacteria group bacterium]